MAIPPLNIDAPLMATLPAIQSTRSRKLEVSKNWLSDWRQARKCISDAHTVRRNQLLDNSKILHQDIAEQAQVLSSRKFEQSKHTLEEWSNLQELVKKFTFPSPPTSSRLLRANDQTALNAILSPRYRRQVAYNLSDDSAVRERFSLSKSQTSGAIGCHVNTAITEGKCATVKAAPDTTSLNTGHFFLTEPEIFGLPVVDSKSSLHSPPKNTSFRDPSMTQMEAFRSLSSSLSQKMKSLIELTGMLALHVLDDHKRRQLRKELESTKEVCQELKKKLENIGVASPFSPKVKIDYSTLAAENDALLRRIETLHPLQMLLARTVTSLHSEDEAILKRTQSELQSCVASVNLMSRKNIKQLNAANEISVRDRTKRQRFWMECTYVILSVYRLVAMRPMVDSKYQIHTKASLVITKFFRQKTLSKRLTRQAKAVRVLTRAMMHYTKWVLRMRRKKDASKIIKQFLIECRDVHPAAKTIKKFRKRVISIQKMVRHFLMRRNFLYMRLLSRWVRSEEKQRKHYNALVTFKYEEKPSIREQTRIDRLRKAVQERQRIWMQELRLYLRARQAYKDELEVSRMLRMQMECFMQGRALSDTVIRGLPKDTRRIYKKLNSNPPKPPPQKFEFTDAEMNRMVHAELFKDSAVAAESVKVPDKKHAAFQSEKSSARKQQKKSS